MQGPRDLASSKLPKAVGFGKGVEDCRFLAARRASECAWWDDLGTRVLGKLPDWVGFGVGVDCCGFHHMVGGDFRAHSRLFVVECDGSMARELCGSTMTS